MGTRTEVCIVVIEGTCMNLSNLITKHKFVRTLNNGLKPVKIPKYLQNTSPLINLNISSNSIASNYDCVAYYKSLCYFDCSNTNTGSKAAEDVAAVLSHNANFRGV